MPTVFAYIQPTCSDTGWHSVPRVEKGKTGSPPLPLQASSGLQIGREKKSKELDVLAPIVELLFSVQLLALRVRLRIRQEAMNRVNYGVNTPE